MISDPTEAFSRTCCRLRCAKRFDPFFAFAFGARAERERARSCLHVPAGAQRAARYARGHLKTLIEQDDATDLAGVRVQVAETRVLQKEPAAQPTRANQSIAAVLQPENRQIQLG